MTGTRKLLFLGIGLLASLFGAVLLLELALGGWLFNDPWNATKSLNIVRDRSIEYSVESIYGAGAPKVVYTRDRFGLRGQCDRPNRIFMLTVGGSTTDQRYISDGQTYQDILSARMSESTGTPVRICNAGVDGHSTFGHLAAFDRWFPLIPDLRPHYVLLYIGINDAGFRLLPMPEREPSGAASLGGHLATAIREKSALYGLDRTLHALFQRGGERHYARHGSNLPPDDAYTATATTAGIDALIAANVAGFSARLGALLERVRAVGARPVCVTQPHLFWNRNGDSPRGMPEVFQHDGVNYNGLDYHASKVAIDDAMQWLCTRAGGEFINIKVRSFDRTDFYDPVHMTPAGARRLADYLYEEMEWRGLFATPAAGEVTPLRASIRPSPVRPTRRIAGGQNVAGPL